MIKIENICVCGGGGLGTVCAGIFSHKRFKVSMLTGKPAIWKKHVTIIDCFNHVFEGPLQTISDCPSEVVPNADLILLCVPGYLIEDTLRKISPFLKNNAIVGSVVSSTGFFYFSKIILPSSFPLFGFQRVPYIARVQEYGKSGNLLGYKSELKAAVENVEIEEATEIISFLSSLFDTPTILLSNIYEASLTNSNPILHTGRLYAMWKGKENESSHKISYFYRDWDDESSHIVFEMDKEFMDLTSKLGIPQKVIPSLKNYYEVNDIISFTQKIQSISAFKNIPSPMHLINDRWFPDFKSRYFTEDFPFGLRFIRNLMKENDIPCITIDKVYAWGMKNLNYDNGL